jgi:hypothetical protein
LRKTHTEKKKRAREAEKRRNRGERGAKLAATGEDIAHVNALFELWWSLRLERPAFRETPGPPTDAKIFEKIGRWWSGSKAREDAPLSEVELREVDPRSSAHAVVEARLKELEALIALVVEAADISAEGENRETIGEDKNFVIGFIRQKIEEKNTSPGPPGATAGSAEAPPPYAREDPQTQ